jgi:intracellular sulfur oxidation DsrE/DsrF family protein
MRRQRRRTKKQATEKLMNRTSFLGAGAAVGLSSISLANAAEPVPGGRAFVEPRSAFDESGFNAKLGKPAQIRQVWDNVAFKPGMLNNVKNALNGLHFGFGYPADELTLALANHGPSTAYNCTDAMWAKYRIGEFLALRDTQGTPITRNVFLSRRNSLTGPSDPNDPSSPFQDASIEALQSRGVIFLACHTGIEELSRGLVKAGHAPSGMSGSDVAADILMHLIPGAHVVPAMVAAIAVVQARFHYTYITVQS